MKEIDKKTFKKINQYNYFKTFEDPTYGFNVRVDVTKLVEYIKAHKITFFIAFLYLVTISMNEVYEMHLRDFDNKIIYFEDINPTFTVLSIKNGVFYNTRCDLAPFKEFNSNCRKVIDKLKYADFVDDIFNDDDYAVYYISCITDISLESMSHPTPSNNHLSSSVPRVFWDKYKFENNKYTVLLNIVVSHVFVDGYPLSKCFQNLEEKINNLDKYLNLD